MRGTLFLVAIWIAAQPAAAAAGSGRDEEARFARRLDEAERYLRRGNTARARRIFEELLEQRPENREAFHGLVSARIEAYDLEGLIPLIEERLTRQSDDRDLALLLGDALAVSGDEAAALAAWEAALPLFDTREDGYRRIARRMENRRIFLPAIEYLRRGRTESGDWFLFAGDLCRLLSLTGDGEGAAVEWVRAAAAQTKKGAEALQKIRELREDEEIAAFPYGEMRAILDSLPSLSAVREILAECYLEDHRCADALREYEELEAIHPKCGAFLMPFARRAADRGCGEQAIEAAKKVARRCDRPTIRLDARLLMARVHRSEGDPDEAARIYRRAIDETRNGKEKNRVRLDLAVTLLDEMGDAEEAVPVLEKLLAEAGEGGKREARFLLAKARRVAGRFDEALASYESLLAEAPDDATRERALFETGLTRFFAGDPDGALTEYRKVIDQYPAGLYLNDALVQSIFITEHRDAGDGALNEYAAALLLIDRKDYTGARRKMEAMAKTLVVSKLRDDLAWNLALIAEEEGHYREAIEMLDRIVEEFPGERMAHRASVRAGEIACERLGEYASGIARYEKFLVDYPESILAEEARRKKREAERRSPGF